MAELVKLRLDGFLQLRDGVRRGTSVLQRPFAGNRGRDVLRVCRKKSAGSVQAQFDSQTYMGRAASYRWERTGPFGRRPAPKATMVRKGAYKRAALGGKPGAYEKITDNEIVFGVDENIHPQEAMHQKNAPTRIRANPNNRTSKGRLKMQGALYAITGVWFPESFLLGRGFIMQPRKFGVNTRMLRDVIRYLQNELLFAITRKRVSNG